MSYEPGVITTLANKLGSMDRIMPGYGFWYGELGKDTEFAKMILDGATTEELKAWVIENYGDDPEYL